MGSNEKGTGKTRVGIISERGEGKEEHANKSLEIKGGSQKVQGNSKVAPARGPGGVRTGRCRQIFRRVLRKKRKKGIGKRAWCVSLARPARPEWWRVTERATRKGKERRGKGESAGREEPKTTQK